MDNNISKEFNLISLVKFSLPTVIMMLVTSFYVIVDGMFVSNIVGINGLSALNIVEPLLNLFFGVGVMFGTGGSAIIGKKLGEEKQEEANEDLSLITFSLIIISIIMLTLVLTNLDRVIRFLGASDVLYDYCYEYLKIYISLSPFLVLQMIFSNLFVTAGRPGVGLFFTTLAGVMNIFLDYLFMVPFNMGISGAALGTTIGSMIPSIAGIIFFFINKKGLHYGKLKFRKEVLFVAITNGMSEMVGHISMCITNWLFNITLMRMLGETGVAAISLLLYAQFLFNSMYLGFSSGIAPIFSYNYGSKNHKQLKILFKNSLLVIFISVVVIYVLSNLMASEVVSVFIPKTNEYAYNLSLKAYYLFSIAYLFSGFNIFASSLFTALSNGKVSAIISFMRTFVFITGAILILPNFIGANGLWLAIPCAEILSIIFSIYFVFKYKKKYGYL